MTIAPIMPELKTATQALHDATEHGTFNKRLVMGALPRQAYIDLLGQFYIVHRELEGRLLDALESRPDWREIVRDYQFQAPYLRQDLEFFGADPESVEPLPATNTFVARIHELADRSPVATLGMHYVFEGSNNGSRFIARALRRAYNLEGDGLRYFDPYGDKQAEYWHAFKEAMNGIEWSREETAEMIQAAQIAFEGTGSIHADLGRRYAAEIETAPARHGCPAMRPN